MVSRSTSQKENNELIALSLDLLDEKKEAARMRNWSYQQDVARTYKKVRTITFQQGDWVLRRAEKNNGETHLGWEGPYKVIEVRRAGAYRLQDSKGKIQPNCWNALHLKAYHFEYGLRIMISILLYTIMHHDFLLLCMLNVSGQSL